MAGIEYSQLHGSAVLVGFLTLAEEARIVDPIVQVPTHRDEVGPHVQGIDTLMSPVVLPCLLGV